jgi:AcrR family transcriptional regulator
MRITEETKRANRAKVLQAAGQLFIEKGFEDTTTRDIAQAAGLAVGTMFNYFPSKETLAMTMVNEALLLGGKDYCDKRNGEEELTEELFLSISSELQRLRPMHPFIGPVLEKSLSPFQKKNGCREGESAREMHLKRVRRIFGTHGYAILPQAVTEQIYWSLYLGILAFWSKDDSPNQEATLAMIDYSMQLFTRMLETSEPL